MHPYIGIYKYVQVEGKSWMEKFSLRQSGRTDDITNLKALLASKYF